MHHNESQDSRNFQQKIGCDYMAEMVIENYRSTDSVDEAEQIIQQAREENVERAGLMKRLKLKALVKSEKVSMRLQSARLLWPELLPSAQLGSVRGAFDLDVWGKFLPTAHRLKDYRFDSIPFEAMKHVEAARDLKIFNKIEIWTPEGNSAQGRIAMQNWASPTGGALIDPMAVGIVDTSDRVRHYFSIARWGESLEPFDDIKRYVEGVDRQIVLRRLVPPAITMLISLSLLLLGLTRFLGSIGNDPFGLSVMTTIAGAMGVSIATVLGITRWKRERFYSLGSQYHRLTHRS